MTENITPVEQTEESHEPKKNKPTLKGILTLLAGLALIITFKELSKNREAAAGSPSTSKTVEYWKWPCKLCGKPLIVGATFYTTGAPFPETAENGYCFCSRECASSFVNLQNTGHY